MAHSSTLKGMIFGFLGFTAFTVADALAKYLGQHFPALQISFMASMVALCALLVFSRQFGGLRSAFMNSKRKLLILRGLVLGAQGITAVAAFSSGVALAKIYTIIFVAPFLALLMGVVFLGDRVGWRRWLSVLFGFSGVLIALRPGMIPLDSGTLLALTCGILAATSWIMARIIGQGQSFMAFALYPLLCILIVTAYPALSDFVMPAHTGHVLAVFASGGAALAGIILLSHAFTLAPADAVSPFHYTQLLFGALWGYLFFTEVPDIWTVIGGTVIVASGLYIVYRERKKGNFKATNFEQSY